MKKIIPRQFLKFLFSNKLTSIKGVKRNILTWETKAKASEIVAPLLEKYFNKNLNIHKRKAQEIR